MHRRPRRSTRCETCRRRKLKCDGKQPCCERCVRSGLQCEGYVHDLIFVQCTTSIRKPSGGQKAQLQSIEGKHDHGDHAHPLNISISANHHRAGVFNCFLIEYFPKRDSLSEHSLQWMTQLGEDFQEPLPFLGLAASAIGTVVLARTTLDTKMLAAGMELYGKSMLELRNRQLTRLNWPQALAAILVLQIYEAVESSAPSGDSWMRHTIGICSILRAVGPAALQEGFNHEIFLCCRLSVTIGSIAFQVPTMLAAPEWRSVPWEKLPKDHLHRLLDVLTLLPSLLHASDELSMQESSTQHSASTFCRLRRHIRDELDRWFADLQTARVDPLFRETPVEGNPAAPFTTQLHYASLVDSLMLTLYWEAKLHCYMAAHRVAQNASVPAEAETGAALDALVDSADKICQSVPHMQDKEFGILGMHFTIHPTLAASQFYEDQGMREKRAWCSNVIEQMACRPFSVFSRS